MGRILAARSIAPMKKRCDRLSLRRGHNQKNETWQKQKKGKEKDEEAGQRPSRHPVRCFYQDDAGLIYANKGKIKETTMPSAAKTLMTVQIIWCFLLLLEFNI